MVRFVFVPGSVGGHVDVIMKVLSWFGSQSFIRADVIMNVLSWWCSWFGVPGGHVDVIMIVRSWWFVRSFAAVKMSS